MLLNRLSNLDGTSGDEGEVRKYIRERIKEHVNKIEVDSLGNLICFKKGRKKNTRDQ